MLMELSINILNLMAARHSNFWEGNGIALCTCQFRQNLFIKYRLFIIRPVYFQVIRFMPVCDDH